MFPGRVGYDLLFNVDMVDLLWGEGGRRDRTPHFVIFVVWSAVVVSWWVVAAWGKKSHLGLAEISSIACLVHSGMGGGQSTKSALAKSRSVRGASHQPIFIDSCLTIGPMCLPCLPNR